MALVGNNGCGKTTIIKLLLRFYDPDRGCILLNGKDIRGYALKELRGCYSAMFQNFCNYAFTVRDSISLSQYEHVTDQAVDYALQKSGAKPMVDDFEHGLDTYLTRQYAEQGVELSGGQWQKIALGRTFYKTAKVFILDEPSAALDAESEDKLLNRFNELYQESGAIIVSHRLSNVSGLDFILVVDEGRIIEQGRHADLMAISGKYAKMYRLQADKYK